MTTVSGVKRAPDRYSDQRANQRLAAEQRAGEQWRARLQDQEARIADLESRIDRANESIDAAVGMAQYETPVSRYQSIPMGRLARMQEMLDQQTRRRAMMQDAARRGGIGQLQTSAARRNRGSGYSSIFTDWRGCCWDESQEYYDVKPKMAHPEWMAILEKTKGPFEKMATWKIKHPCSACAIVPWQLPQLP